MKIIFIRAKEILHKQPTTYYVSSFFSKHSFHWEQKKQPAYRERNISYQSREKKVQVDDDGLYFVVAFDFHEWKNAWSVEKQEKQAGKPAFWVKSPSVRLSGRKK